MSGDKDEQSDLDDLIDSHKPPSHPKRDNEPPGGFQPGVTMKGNTGHAELVLPAGQDPRWGEFLEEFGYGNVLELVEVVEVRAWQTFSKDHGKQNLRYIKARVVKRRDAADVEDLERLKDWIMKDEPPQEPLAPFISGNEKTLLVFLSDWQLGKREGGGSRATVERINQAIEHLIEYVSVLRNNGHVINEVVLCGMGDMVESCSGFYPMQEFQVDLHMRQQRMVVRRLLIRIAKKLRPHFAKITFRAVPGNHGEVRKGGAGSKAFTSFSDNNDVCIFDQLRDVVAEARWGEGIDVHTTQVGKPELTMSFKIENGEGASVAVGLAHGHQAGSHSRGDPADKIKKWWTDCSGSRHPIGYVDMLCTGHYHHLRVEDRGERRTWFQCPTLDGGSFWYWARGGRGSVPGMLVVLADPAHPRGWCEVKVL